MIETDCKLIENVNDRCLTVNIGLHKPTMLMTDV